MFAIIVGIVVLLLVIFFTPENLSHYAWSVRCKRVYTVDGERGYRMIEYDHTRTDGMRICHRLKSHRLPAKILFCKHPTPQFDIVCRIKTSKYATNISASPFMNILSYILSHSKIMSEHQSAAFCILVGTRDKLAEKQRFSKGCFVRTAFLRASNAMDMQAIADDCVKKCREIKEDDRLCDTFAERLALLKCDFVFNKWPLMNIKRDDGHHMRLYIDNIPKVDFEYFLNINHPLDVKVCFDGEDTFLLASPLWLTL